MERLYNNIKDEQRNESQGGKRNKNMKTRCVSFCRLPLRSAKKPTMKIDPIGLLLATV